MLLPKRTKFRKLHRGRLKGIATKSNTIVFGDYGIQALEPVWLTSRQIEATRRSITRYVRRTGKIWIRVFPDKPITERPAETRMGSGKGAPAYWVAVVKPGNIIFEKYCLFCSNIFCVKIASPIEPRIIIPTDANNSSLTNAELI